MRINLINLNEKGRYPMSKHDKYPECGCCEADYQNFHNALDKIIKYAKIGMKNIATKLIGEGAFLAYFYAGNMDEAEDLIQELTSQAQTDVENVRKDRQQDII